MVQITLTTVRRTRSVQIDMPACAREIIHAIGQTGAAGCRRRAEMRVKPVLSTELKQRLDQAFQQARGARHEFLTVEYLLLAILNAATVRQVLEGCGANLEQLASDLQQYIEAHTLWLEPGEEEPRVQPQLGFQRVLQRSVYHVQSSGKNEVGALNILVAIFSEKQSHAVFLLTRAQVTRADVLNYIERSKPLA
jgi:ATP-dependent Clp protease ATP-binding subunit ClpA